MLYSEVDKPADSFRKTALVVNSGTAERERLYRFLSRCRYRALTAGSFEEAVEICRTYAGSIHLLVTDCEQSDMSGYDLAKSATAIRPELVVLFLPPVTASNPAPYRHPERAKIALDVATVVAMTNQLSTWRN